MINGERQEGNRDEGWAEDERSLPRGDEVRTGFSADRTWQNKEREHLAAQRQGMWDTIVVWGVSTKAAGDTEVSQGAMVPMMKNVGLSSKWWGATEENAMERSA